ncbi:MAG TPA: hypothetical protein VGM94_04965 [Galbitalea sp.]|jgi:hypothetical protein
MTITLSRTKYLITKTRRQPLALTSDERAEIVQTARALAGATAVLIRAVRGFGTDVVRILEAVEKRAQ